MLGGMNINKLVMVGGWDDSASWKFRFWNVDWL